MELELSRLWYTQQSCCGQLDAPGLKLYTLELPVRDGLPGSAIPPGRYPIRLLSSPKFMQAGLKDKWIEQYSLLMPHVICPPRSQIMIHWGNDVENTTGCIIVGRTHEPDFVGESRYGFAELYYLIYKSAIAGDCFITIEGGIPTAPVITT